MIKREEAPAATGASEENNDWFDDEGSDSGQIGGGWDAPVGEDATCSPHPCNSGFAWAGGCDG